MLLCAGAYVSGADGSNECPAGSVRIETEAACRTAVAAAGKTEGTPLNPFAQKYSNLPRGCYYVGGNDAYFNSHRLGAGFALTWLLCASLTTGAPLHADARRGSVHRSAGVPRRGACWAVAAGRCAHRDRDARVQGSVQNNDDTNGSNIETLAYIYIYVYIIHTQRRPAAQKVAGGGRISIYI